MDVEIIIKVPLSANVSVQQKVTGAGVPGPPSPAEFGIPTVPSAAEMGPPSAEMIERIVAATSATSESPPQLDQLPPEVLRGWGLDVAAGPPDLPTIGAVPPVEDEFAPPPNAQTDESR